MKLDETQNSLKKLTLNPFETIDVGMKPAGRLSIKQAFEIYHQNYVARLSEALKHNFECIGWLLGQNIFADLCNQYIDREATVSYNLEAFGENFPEFLRLHSATRHIPFVFDMGRFEWAYKCIFHSQNPDPLPVERIQELIRADDFKVHLIPAMTVFQSDYAVSALWGHRHQPDYLFEETNWSTPESLVIFKKHGKVEIERISPLEAEILKELQEGSSISQALGDYSNRLTPDRIDQFFHLMMKSGIIEDILVTEL